MSWRPSWSHPITRAVLMWLAACLFLSLAARAVVQEGLADVPGLTLPQRLQEIFEAFDGDRPGVAVGVSRNGEVLYQSAHGLADLDRQVRIDPDTAFHIASVGKQITAVAVLMLVEAGKVRLDEPASKYLKEMRGWAREVTVRDLLQHTAGIPDTYPALEERGGTPTGLDALRLLARWKRLDFEPGSQFQYSDSGYDLLGTLIERVSHRSYPKFVEERILRPAGMKDSFVFDEARLRRAKRALGYERGFGQWVLKDDSPLNLLYGSGGVYSTVADLARYDQALFGSRLIRPASLAEMLKPNVLNDGTVVTYGFGWWVGKTEAGETYYGHSGNWLGFTAYYLHFPRDGMAVMVLGNSSDIDCESLAFATAAAFRSAGNTRLVHAVPPSRRARRP
ncbi:MAG TPA: serine hydrolase domain-containing protein [Thermoanaerobaculia bacterium]